MSLKCILFCLLDQPVSLKLPIVRPVESIQKLTFESCHLKDSWHAPTLLELIYKWLFNILHCPSSSVAEWLECWTQVNFTRARGPGFDSWMDPSKKIARPQDSDVVTCPAGGPGKTRLTRPSTPSSSVELGGRVVRVLDSGQLHQSEMSWVRFLDEHLKNCQASGQSRGHLSSGWTRKNTVD